MDTFPQRPATPQPLMHFIPTTRSLQNTKQPESYIILIQAPTATAGKLPIATAVAKALGCPLFQGDSMHESCHKMVSVGFARSGAQSNGEGKQELRKERYQGIWLRKLSRTGLLFPGSSRAASWDRYEGRESTGDGNLNVGIDMGSGNSRRGSDSSIDSAVDVGSHSTSSFYIHKPIAHEVKFQGKEGNSVLMVLTHPDLEDWHRRAIREAVGGHGIGVLFVPLSTSEHGGDDELEKEEELPVLRPLDPRSFMTFDEISGRGGYGVEELQYGKGKKGNLEEEMVLKVAVNGIVDGIIEDILLGVRAVVSA